MILYCDKVKTNVLTMTSRPTDGPKNNRLEGTWWLSPLPRYVAKRKQQSTAEKKKKNSALSSRGGG